MRSRMVQNVVCADTAQFIEVADDFKREPMPPVDSGFPDVALAFHLFGL